LKHLLPLHTATESQTAQLQQKLSVHYFLFCSFSEFPRHPIALKVLFFSGADIYKRVYFILHLTISNFSQVSKMKRGNRPQNGLLLAGLIGLAILATVAAEVANAEPSLPNEVLFSLILLRQSSSHEFNK